MDDNGSRKRRNSEQPLDEIPLNTFDTPDTGLTHIEEAFVVIERGATINGSVRNLLALLSGPTRQNGNFMDAVNTMHQGNMLADRQRIIPVTIAIPDGSDVDFSGSITQQMDAVLGYLLARYPIDREGNPISLEGLKAHHRLLYDHSGEEIDADLMVAIQDDPYAMHLVSLLVFSATEETLPAAILTYLFYRRLGNAELNLARTRIPLLGRNVPAMRLVTMTDAEWEQLNPEIQSAVVNALNQLPIETKLLLSYLNTVAFDTETGERRDGLLPDSIRQHLDELVLIARNFAFMATMPGGRICGTDAVSNVIASLGSTLLTIDLETPNRAILSQLDTRAHTRRQLLLQLLYGEQDIPPQILQVFSQFGFKPEDMQRAIRLTMDRVY